ncbi:hypothetical protein BDZ94DRAFT_1252436 [Collybia nuda]|uniref:t-SNARE coiled-coil homology domain-containing protein n=1 Tax=Collybia nuda TaxID=64659 RepID=A0A9P5YBS9_9AGAR|nr:hypothetical protein BDZ94DRAFT_1252436 [Collybia nuda]
MSLARLTSLSTQTLSLLLERQRLHTLPSFSTSDSHSTKPVSLHLPQITKNLNKLRVGILDLEGKEGRSEAVRLLRSQHERMRGMLNGEGDVESLDPEVEDTTSLTPSPPTTPPSDFPPNPPAKDGESLYSPYTDDPEAGYEPGMIMETQRQMMDEQDVHLDRLAHSISRQHHISLQINDELDVHTGLLQELDTDLDRTESRLTGARRRLDQVAKGAKENGSMVTIALLILVLLILIIIFKT